MSELRSKIDSKNLLAFKEFYWLLKMVDITLIMVDCVHVSVVSMYKSKRKKSSECSEVKNCQSRRDWAKGR